ncbi:type II toxin-antitoxin system RelE/ParE family toxin [Massilia sp. SM-13]|uniref:type II toxin-antitoxin system RelE/ParE family toxin n=1 Tax=Pseudoduganella rhizocola TaxID=3382643 RepID=UPI0038B42AD1
MIQSFADNTTRSFYEGKRIAKWQAITAQAMRKLYALNSARHLIDLRLPLGNRLEPPTGNRNGQHSIRINDKWRICFRWTENGPAEVEICNYH